MLDVLPAPPPAIIVEAAADHTPLVLLGFVGTGSTSALDCVENLSTSSGLKSARTQGPNDIPEVMVLFTPGTARSAQLQTYNAARSGQCGAKIEVFVVPVSALTSRNYLDASTIEDPTYIIEPK